MAGWASQQSAGPSELDSSRQTEGQTGRSGLLVFSRPPPRVFRFPCCSVTTSVLDARRRMRLKVKRACDGEHSRGIQRGLDRGVSER